MGAMVRFTTSCYVDRQARNGGDGDLDGLNRAMCRHACAISELLFSQSDSLERPAISCFSAKQSSQFIFSGL